MSDAPVLDAAHRDRGRRRAMLAGMGSAVAVAAIAVGVVVIGPSGDEGVQVGGPAAQTSDQPQQTGTEDTKAPGQTDPSANSGPEWDHAGELGRALGTALDAVIPAGYESPDDLKASEGYRLKSNQAQHMTDTTNGTEGWGYDAFAPLTKGNGVGELSVSVRSPSLVGAGSVCDIAKVMGTSPEKCTELTVDGKKVGVIDVVVDGQQAQKAVYRAASGSAVSVTQSAAFARSGLPALDGLPLTAEQLAALTVDPRFDVA